MTKAELRELRPVLPKPIPPADSLAYQRWDHEMQHYLRVQSLVEMGREIDPTELNFKRPLLYVSAYFTGRKEYPSEAK